MNYVYEWFIDWKWALGKIIFCTDLFSLVVWLFRFSDPLIMNEKLQLVWIFTVLIESLNECCYCIDWIMVWAGMVLNDGPQWSGLCWKTLTQSQTDDADWSQSNLLFSFSVSCRAGRRCEEEENRIYWDPLMIQTNIWIYSEPKSQPSLKAHLKVTSLLENDSEELNCHRSLAV